MSYTLLSPTRRLKSEDLAEGTTNTELCSNVHASSVCVVKGATVNDTTPFPKLANTRKVYLVKGWTLSLNV